MCVWVCGKESGEKDSGERRGGENARTKRNKVTEHEERERRREAAERPRERERLRWDNGSKLMWTKGQGTIEKGKRRGVRTRERETKQGDRERKGTEKIKVVGRPLVRIGEHDARR